MKLAVIALAFMSTTVFASGVDLTGTWSGACRDNAEMNSSLRVNFSFNDADGNPGSGITNVHVFAGEGCKALVKKTNFIASYVQGDEFGEGFLFNMVVEKVLETSLNDEMTEMLNTASHCGFSDWITGFTKIVDLARCNRQLVGVPSQTLYTIINVKQNDAGASYLLFGDRSGDDNGTSEAKRPKVLNPHRQFFKNPAGS